MSVKTKKRWIRSTMVAAVGRWTAQRRPGRRASTRLWSRVHVWTGDWSSASTQRKKPRRQPAARHVPHADAHSAFFSAFFFARISDLICLVFTCISSRDALRSAFSSTTNEAQSIGVEKTTEMKTPRLSK